ncbi:MAG: hypothetical protein JW863_14280 [Chitinispirillaceae bacterium]|nr:hypothetical protein [Chitinispirillaceae bacterium]
MFVAHLFSTNLLKTTLALVIAAGVVFFCQSADSKKASADTAPVPAKTAGPAAATPQQQQQKLVVYYFHTTFRCRSCNLIEAFTKEAISTGFSDQLKNGRIELKVINIEEPGNEHFGEDYKLYTKSVILSDVRDGKEASWKNLDKVWTLLGDQDKFIDYIQTEVKTLL